MTSYTTSATSAGSCDILVDEVSDVCLRNDIVRYIRSLFRRELLIGQHSIRKTH